jgi:hypothetical protein
MTLINMTRLEEARRDKNDAKARLATTEKDKKSAEKTSRAKKMPPTP